MLSVCLKCKKKTESKNPQVVKTKNGKIMFFLSKWVVFSNKNWRFTKEQEADGLLTRLGIRPLIYNSIKFWHYYELSWFPKTLSLKSFGNSWCNSYIIVYYKQSGFISLVVKGKLDKTSKILKIVWPLFSEKFSFELHFLINP